MPCRVYARNCSGPATAYRRIAMAKLLPELPASASPWGILCYIFDVFISAPTAFAPRSYKLYHEPKPVCHPIRLGFIQFFFKKYSSIMKGVVQHIMRNYAELYTTPNKVPIFTVPYLAAPVHVYHTPVCMLSYAIRHNTKHFVYRLPVLYCTD
jgi:hypothetical protein